MDHNTPILGNDPQNIDPTTGEPVKQTTGESSSSSSSDSSDTDSEQQDGLGSVHSFKNPHDDDSDIRTAKAGYGKKKEKMF